MSSPPRKVLAAAVCLVLMAPSLALAAKEAGKKAPHARHTRVPRPAVAPRAEAAPPLVRFGNIVIGTDPDPRIRQQLLRDLGAVFGGAD